jgi:hypothetical protein
MAQAPDTDWLVPVIGVAGVGLGWILNQVSSRFTRRSERARDVAAQWRESVVETWLQISPRTAQRADVRDARREWRRAWMLFSGAVPLEVSERIEPLHYLLYALDVSAEDLKEGMDRASPYYEVVAHSPKTFFHAVDVVERAFCDALAALDAFMLGRRLPPRGFLTPEEMLPILSRHGAAVENRLFEELAAAAARFPMPERSRLGLSGHP